MQEVLVGCLDARVVIVGEDFHFGHQRRGNVDAAAGDGRRTWASRSTGCPLVDATGSAAAGDGPGVLHRHPPRPRRGRPGHAAAHMLGRPHEVRGIVAHGDERGRELGFPTANVSVPGDILLPADGIYAGWYERADGTVRPAALSLGPATDVLRGGRPSLLEAHLLDFDDDLYGEHVRVRFVARLRGEERYDSVDVLVAQIAVDCEEARRILG